MLYTHDIHSLFLIKPMYLIGVWLLVRIDEQKTLGHMFKEVGLRLQNLLATPHS